MFCPKIDRTSMSRGVESRALFLDQRLYETNITNSKYTISRRDRRFEHELLEKLQIQKLILIIKNKALDYL